MFLPFLVDAAGLVGRGCSVVTFLAQSGDACRGRSAGTVVLRGVAPGLAGLGRAVLLASRSFFVGKM